jgi:hypothetical protein
MTLRLRNGYHLAKTLDTQSIIWLWLVVAVVATQLQEVVVQGACLPQQLR